MGLSQFSQSRPLPITLIWDEEKRLSGVLYGTSSCDTCVYDGTELTSIHSSERNSSRCSLCKRIYDFPQIQPI